MEAGHIVALRKDKGADFSLLGVQKLDAHGDGLEYWKTIHKDVLNSTDTIIYEGNVQIAGVNGSRLDYTYQNTEQSSIIFIKNGYLYRLLFTTNKVSDIESEINTIINSFQTN